MPGLSGLATLLLAALAPAVAMVLSLVRRVMRLLANDAIYSDAHYTLSWRCRYCVGANCRNRVTTS